jgi:catechol 2,3-dioxygenase-like lactoylglutathione lyase family enzyme
MAASVRCIVDDVPEAIEFYERLGFEVQTARFQRRPWRHTGPARYRYGERFPLIVKVPALSRNSHG